MSIYGKRKYDKTTELKKECIGIYTCPNCYKESKLIKQSCRGFTNILSICNEGHTYELAKELHEYYHEGDTVRCYQSTFGKDSVLILDSYTEGIVIKTYPALTDYKMDIQITKSVGSGKEVPPSAWIIGHISHGVSQNGKEIKLLKKHEAVSYEQMRLVI